MADTFMPNCAPDPDGSTNGRVRLICEPICERKGQVFTSQRPVKIILERGKNALIEDDGGAPDFVLEKLLKHIERNRL